MRTISVTTDAQGVTDVDGGIATDLEALRQRVVQAIRFQFGTWFLDSRRGIRRELIQGHETTLGIAAATITQAIRDEGGDEITGIELPVVQLDFDTREFRYSARISTIYGATVVSGGI